MVLLSPGISSGFLRWLGIDFFGTLWRTGYNDGPKTAWKELEAAGIHVDINQLWPSYRRHDLDDLTGRISTNEKYARILADLGLFSNTDPVANRKLILALRAAEKRDLIIGGGVLQGAVSFLKWAKSRGIGLILVSNATEVGTEVQLESGLMGYFDSFATSRRLGAIKGPEDDSADLFSAFLSEYGLDPNEGVIVDDEQRWLDHAHRAGFYTALLTQAWPGERTIQGSFSPDIIAPDFTALYMSLRT